MREDHSSSSGFIIGNHSGSSSGVTTQEELELSTFEHTSYRYVSFAAPLMQKFGSDIAAINRLIETGEDLLESSGSRSDANTIKKNLMWLTSLKMMLEVINHQIDQGSKGISSPFVFPSHEDMNSLVAKYGANSDSTHFDNSTTRAFLIHFPRMLEQFLLMQSHLREYTKLTKFIDNITKFDKWEGFDNGEKQCYPLFLALTIADQFGTKAQNYQALFDSIAFPDERNVEKLLKGIESYLSSDLEAFLSYLKKEMLPDYLSEIHGNPILEEEELTDKQYEDFITKSKLRIIELVINSALVESLYNYFTEPGRFDFQTNDVLSDLSSLSSDEQFKEICSLRFFTDEDIRQVLNICEIEQKIHFSKQFLVLLTGIKYNKYNPDGVVQDGSGQQQYVYGFKPYDYVLTPGSTPTQFNSDKVEAGSISSLDEFWVKNNSSNIPQVLAYLYSDVLHSGQNLFFKGTQIMPDALLTNRGYPYSLKASHLHALDKYKQRPTDLEALEGSLQLQPRRDERSADIEALSLDDVHLDDTSSKEASIPDPKNNLTVKSGFELEVGIEDSREVEDPENFNRLKQAVQTALLNKLAEEVTYYINEDKKAEIIAGLNAVSRTELALLHLIFVNKIGKNIAFMDIPREKMGQKVVEFLEGGELKQKITDVIYAYEVNIHNPTSLHETVSIAKSLEQELYSFYETNFGVKVVQAPSFQLNVSPWVVDSEGQSNLADPSRQYSRKTMMRDDGTVAETETLSSIKNNVMYTRMIEEVGKELTILIKQDTGIFRCSKIVSHIDWKSYPDRQEQFIQNLGSAYSTHRINSGKSATIRVFGESIKTSRFEIRLFGPNVHMEAQMPNAQNFNERLFNQSEMLDLIAEAVLKAFDTVNREMFFNPKELSPNVGGFGSPRKPFSRPRSFSQGDDTLSRRSGASGRTYMSSTTDVFEEKNVSEEPPTWLQFVSSADEEVSPDTICKVM